MFQVLLMIDSLLRVHYHLIYVCLHSVAQHVCKQPVYHPLVCGSGVDECRGHHRVVIYVIVCIKCDMRRILLRRPYLVVAKICIHEAQQLVLGDGINKLFNTRKSITILRASLVEVF